MKIKLAEALLRRKELANKIPAMTAIKQADIYQVKTTRKAAHEGLDDVIAQVPKLTLSQVTAELDWHSRQLRLIDACIQQANWTVELEVDPTVMADYEAKV